MRKVEFNGGIVALLPVVKGLVAEEDKVVSAIDSLKPDVVGLSVSKEELEGLTRKEDYALYEMSFLEQVYEAHLKEFGEVKLPPPAYVKTLDHCAERGLRTIPLDMNEELYSDTYCIKVGGLDLLRESYFSSRAHSKKFDHSSAEAFVLDWDKKVNRANGFRELNLEREQHMAEVLKKLLGQHKHVLAIIELERVSGVEKALLSK